MSTDERKSAAAFVQELINASPKRVRVIPRSNREHGVGELLGVAGTSTLGAIVDQTGGIVVADGLIRHLGGENRFGTGLREVNAIREKAPTTMEGILLVAFDVFGGWFALDMTARSPREASVHYLPPEAFTWVDMGVGHTAFFDWSLSGETGAFYSNYEGVTRVKPLPALDSIYAFNPPLWAQCAPDGTRLVSYTLARGALAERVGIIESLKSVG